MPTEPQLQLGRAGIRHDERTLRLARYLPADLPMPPEQIDWISKVSSWPMYANDRIGDCTIATAGHLIHSWTFNADRLFVPTEPQVLRAYSAMTGYNPATGENDTGCYELDVLNYWRHVGIAGHKISAYTAVDHTNQTEVMQAIELFGGVYCGASMPLSAWDQVEHGRPWTVGSGTRAQPGSWGGHAFSIGQYDPRRLTAITWGQKQAMSWAWWRRYVDECYVIFTVDLLDMFGRSPLGFNGAQLLKDLAVLNAPTCHPSFLRRMLDRSVGLFFSPWK